MEFDGRLPGSHRSGGFNRHTSRQAASSRKGWIDEAVMRFNDFAFAFPALLTAVMLSAALGPGSFNSMWQ